MTDYSSLVKKYGTPFYLFDIDELQNRLMYLRKSLNKLEQKRTAAAEILTIIDIKMLKNC